MYGDLEIRLVTQT